MEQIIIQIDNDPSSVGEGWTVPAREVLGAFADFVEENVREMYPDFSVVVMLAGRTTVDGPDVATSESVRHLIPHFWHEFVSDPDVRPGISNAF